MKLENALKKVRNRAKIVGREVSIEQNDYHKNGNVKVWIQFEGSNPVSYTHLTLPTTSSV